MYMNAMVRKHKAALTRAKKKGPLAVVVACEAALTSFDSHGYPDCWMDWERAEEDARIALRYNRS